MSAKSTPATVAATRAGVAFTVRTYPAGGRGSSYGREAAEALGVPADRIYKTLVATVDGAVTVAVIPVSTELNLKALAAAVGGKRAAMADPAHAERATGYVRGGISPLGQRKRLPTVIDDAARSHSAILVSAGRRGLQLEIAPESLIELTRATIAPIGAR